MRDFVMDGYVQKQVEDRTTQAGRVVTRFSVNSPDYDRQSGQRTPHYFDVEYWHDPQDDGRHHIQEGALLMLWGSYKQDRWQDKQTGANRSKVVFSARRVALVRPPQPQAYGQAPAAPQAAHATAPQAYAPAPAPQAYAQAPQPYAPAAAPQAPARPAPARQPPAPQPQYPPVEGLYDEDIPF